MGPIVGIGELLWDVYSDGRKVAGGAPFNFAFHCYQLGHEAVIVSRVGNDELGRELREEVKRLGMSDEFIQTDYTFSTGTVNVKLDEYGQPTYEIVRDVAWDRITVDEPLVQLTNRSRVFCFGTLAQRTGQSRSTIQKLKTSFLNRTDNSFLVVFDINLRQPVPDRQLIRESLALSNWVKVNLAELNLLSRCFQFPHCDLRPASIELRLICRSELVCVTSGEDGSWCTSELEEFNEPAAAATILDTVGAGDAFTAAMVVMHLEGRPLRECARFANHYAARVCEHRGATPKIGRREVELAAFGK